MRYGESNGVEKEMASYGQPSSGSQLEQGWCAQLFLQPEGPTCFSALQMVSVVPVLISRCLLQSESFSGWPERARFSAEPIFLYFFQMLQAVRSLMSKKCAASAILFPAITAPINLFLHAGESSCHLVLGGIIKAQEIIRKFRNMNRNFRILIDHVGTSII